VSEKELIVFTYICVFLIFGILIAVAPFIISRLIRPRTRTASQSLETYECGMAPMGQAWDSRHGIAYYLYALIFLAFEVDVLYLFPVAAAFDSVKGMRGLILFALFLGVLSLGIVYAWAKGAFEWTNLKKRIKK